MGQAQTTAGGLAAPAETAATPVSEVAGEPTEPPRRGPGRPPSDAPERILEAAIEVLDRHGYAGLTTARVAAASGQNKAMIAYYYGSKAGLVAAAARRASETFVGEMLAELGSPASMLELIAGMVAAAEGAMERRPEILRVYFGLSAQATAEGEAREIIRDTKDGLRETARGLLAATEDGPPPERADAVATYLQFTLEGWMLERMERGPSPALDAARDLMIEAASAAL